MENINETGTNESFEDLLEQSLDNVQTYNVGDEVEGEIINISDKYIFISLGAKRDAFADIKEYQNKKGELNYKVGDKIKGYIVKSDDSETIVAKSIDTLNKHLLKDAYAEQIPIRGKVTSIIKGGFRIEISGIRAFCPISQMDVKVVTDPNMYVNKEFDFEIIDMDDNAKDIVLSRRNYLEKELAEEKKQMLEDLRVGDIKKGVVTRLTNFGAFVNMGALEGLIHISEFDWNRVDSPSDVLKIGDEIEAKVIKILGDKVSLSLKALKPNPYDVAFEEIHVGDIVTCKVLRNLPFGSFVEIRPGVEGLIPISEITKGRKISRPDEILKIGDTVEAKIQKIDKSTKKISLSIKAMLPDPWDTIDQEFSEGEVVNGTIENVMKFGAFIMIKDGITGLLPISKITLTKMKLSKNDIGKEISLRIARIDKMNKKISLEPTEMPETTAHGKKEDWKKYKKPKKKKETEIDPDNPFNIL